MATEEGVSSVEEVSKSFVDQYFNILEHHPKEAHKFYIGTSIVTRPRPDGTVMNFTSLEAINEHILSCDYGNTTFEVLSVDSQISLEDGIFIMVIGFLTGKDNLRRKFSQMFYLARQNHKYDVLNDIFRYVDEEDSTPKTLPVLESVQPTEKVKQADELKKTELKHKIAVPVENSVNAVKNVVAGATSPLDNGKVKHSDVKAVTAQEPTEPAAPQLDGAKRSFAAIVQSLAKNAAPFQVKAVTAPLQKPKYMGQPRAAAAAQKPASVSKSVKKFDHKIIEEPGTSIFVANLPLNAMPPQLHELFKDFGPIKENGIQVRTSRGQNNVVCFGFIAFESATSVQSVLQAAKNTPFMLADRKLRLKEKDVNYDGSKQPSGKPSGGSGGSKTSNGSAEGGEDEFKPVRSRRNSGKNETQNGSADGDDEFKPVRSRRNGRKNERRGARNANGDSNQKNSEGGAPEVQTPA